MYVDATGMQLLQSIFPVGVVLLARTCSVLGSVCMYYDGVACREVVVNREAMCAVTEK